MGRTKQFDPNSAIKTAMFVFWKNGYEATSMEDLLNEINISRSSFYDTFGNKEDLFLKTIEYFGEMTNKVWEFTLKAKEDASLPEIVRQFSVARRTQVLNPEFGGCYVANSVLELGNHNQEVKISSKNFFDMYKEAFKHCIENAKMKGEIGDHYNSESTALYLVNAITGLSILSKSGSSVEEIDSVIKSTLSIFIEFSDELYQRAIDEMDNKYLPLIMNLMK